MNYRCYNLTNENKILHQSKQFRTVQRHAPNYTVFYGHILENNVGKGHAVPFLSHPYRVAKLVYASFGLKISLAERHRSANTGVPYIY